MSYQPAVGDEFDDSGRTSRGATATGGSAGAPGSKKEGFTFLGCGLATLTTFWGVICGCLVIFGGFFTAISLSSTCIIIGIYMIFTGLIILSMEAPVLCNFSKVTTKIGDFLRKLKHWQKAIIFPGLAIVMFFCVGITSILSGVCLLILGMLHVFTAVGPRGQQAAPAASGYTPQTDEEALGADNQRL